jgi:hypothetical protein
MDPQVHVLYLKGVLHEIFNLKFFLRISFHRALEHTIKAISNFYEDILFIYYPGDICQ